jgi:type I restriction-modification system DNA methylase subunit
VHTLLRLPTGLFYAQGVKANVIFFDRKPALEQFRLLADDLNGSIPDIEKSSNL